MLKLTVFYFIGIGNSYPFVSYVEIEAISKNILE